MTRPLVKFSKSTGFYSELKRRTEEYFELTGLRPRDSVRMYVKTATILMWFALSYVLLVFVAETWWQGTLLACSLGLAMAGIGFDIQHDGGHGAYSRHPAVNRAMAMTLDFLGGSSYVWRCKHNILHHTYANVAGVDADIDLWPIARVASTEPWYRAHRFQHVYMWVFYGFLALKWHCVADFRFLLTGRIGGHRFPRPRGRDLALFVGGKIAFVGWAIVVPLLFHAFWVVLGFFLICSFVLGLTLAVVFQLAHCVEEVDFPLPIVGTNQMEDEWAVHQVRTSANFARSNRLLGWYLGGLNFQIEHHLFPAVSHVHYRALSDIVRGVCAEFGVRYSEHATFFQALRSHLHWLRQLGLPPGRHSTPDGQVLAHAEVSSP